MMETEELVSTSSKNEAQEKVNLNYRVIATHEDPQINLIMAMVDQFIKRHRDKVVGDDEDFRQNAALRWLTWLKGNEKGTRSFDGSLNQLRKFVSKLLKGVNATEIYRLNRGSKYNFDMFSHKEVDSKFVGPQPDERYLSWSYSKIDARIPKSQIDNVDYLEDLEMKEAIDSIKNKISDINSLSNEGDPINLNVISDCIENIDPKLGRLLYEVWEKIPHTPLAATVYKKEHILCRGIKKDKFGNTITDKFGSKVYCSHPISNEGDGKCPICSHDHQFTALRNKFDLSNRKNKKITMSEWYSLCLKYTSAEIRDILKIDWSNVAHTTKKVRDYIKEEILKYMSVDL